MRILIRGTNWIGDAVMSIPALRSLRRMFPDAHISLHTRSWAEGLFQEADFIDDLIVFEKSRWAVKEIYENTQFLKEDSYDLAVLLPNSFESAFTSFLARIPRRIGYNKDARGLLLTDPVPVPEWKSRRHEVFYYLNLAGEVGRRVLGRDSTFDMPPEVTLAVSNERKERARQILADNGLDPWRQTVVLGVGSTNSAAKRWPAAYFAKLNDLLQLEANANVVLLGSKADAEPAGQVIEAAVAKPVDLIGQTDIAEAAALLSVADLMISNDMGLAHIAPAVGATTIAIFGPTDPETTRPFSGRAEVVREPVECSPCMLRDCPIDHRCMTRITPEMVFAKAAALLRAGETEENAEKLGEVIDLTSSRPV